MSDQGERTCPLCAEEMDLTDQHLKPCKCGYDICVWCWHHIMDMAEKDSTEGRCPACRTPYNKEKIVGTASNCEGLVNGTSVEKKQKSQKGKTKASDARNQLGNVRVIQRNLVYVVGLPLDLADEDLLQQKEYFGQYGKVLKVSISRTAAGAIQQFANSTCSVYITYSKEEEAVRCIQSAHGFVLDGRPLRACFGTTKYCHAWLRNTPCTNADCLYLHEFGQQEDSFTKDEIITAYTRNRVQQITGATSDMQRRFGNLLPPPTDDYSNNNSSSAKPICKSTTNNPTNSLKVSPPNSSSGRSVSLPAAASWGARTSNSQPVVTNVASSNGPSNSTKPSFSSAVSGSSFHEDESVNKRNKENHTFQEKGNLGNHVSVKKAVGPDHRKTLLETPVTTTLSSSSKSTSQVSETSPENKNPSKHYFSSVLDKELNIADVKRIENSSCNGSSISINKNRSLQTLEEKQVSEPTVSNEVDLVLDLQKKVAEIAITEAEEDLLSFDNQRLNDKEIFTNTSYIHSTSHYSSQDPYLLANGNLDSRSVDQNFENAPQHAFSTPVINGYSSFNVSNENSYFRDTENGASRMRMFEGSPVKNGNNGTGFDSGESSLISDILSMDFDPWDESLTSPGNLAKFLGDSSNKQQPESHRILSARRGQNSNQSRFSFAREDECSYRESNYAPTASDFRHRVEYKNFSHDAARNSSVYVDNKRTDGNGFSSFNFEESDHFASNYSRSFENKISVSRTHVSAPPGFSGPKRAPPPGFTSHERMEQTGNHTFDVSSLMRKPHEVSAPVNINEGGDLELMDPAILAVGGRVPTFRSNFPTQMNTCENDIRLQLLMQTSSFSDQNPRFTQLRDHYPNQIDDSYRLPSRMVENNLSSYQQPRNVNGHLNSWNAKYELPTCSDVYNNTTFGI